ncbi:MAG TPA: isochorismatase family protein [Nitrospira sp.]|nr:isochorismatase family protein [Nitrospira sp.]
MTLLDVGDGLLIADIQNDFLPGGALGVVDGDKILPALRTYIDRFHSRGLPIFVTRDWHPPHHCSFRDRGGPWPVHCVAGSAGALPPDDFQVPASSVIIYKAIDPDEEAYSAFHHTPLQRHLKALGVRRLFIGGLTTEYCVLSTVKDARALGYETYVLMDAMKPVNPDDGRRAEEEMLWMGARPVTLKDLPA